MPDHAGQGNDERDDRQEVARTALEDDAEGRDAEHTEGVVQHGTSRRSCPQGAEARDDEHGQPQSLSEVAAQRVPPSEAAVDVIDEAGEPSSGVI